MVRVPICLWLGELCNPGPRRLLAEADRVCTEEKGVQVARQETRASHATSSAPTEPRPTLVPSGPLSSSCCVLAWLTFSLVFHEVLCWDIAFSYHGPRFNIQNFPQLCLWIVQSLILSTEGLLSIFSAKPHFTFWLFAFSFFLFEYR